MATQQGTRTVTSGSLHTVHYKRFGGRQGLHAYTIGDEHYGYLNMKPVMATSEIAERLGVCRGRIGQIEEEAVVKILMRIAELQGEPVEWEESTAVQRVQQANENSPLLGVRTTYVPMGSEPPSDAAREEPPMSSESKECMSSASESSD